MLHVRQYVTWLPLTSFRRRKNLYYISRLKRNCFAPTDLSGQCLEHLHGIPKWYCSASTDLSVQCSKHLHSVPNITGSSPGGSMIFAVPQWFLSIGDIKSSYFWSKINAELRRTQIKLQSNSKGYFDVLHESIRIEILRIKKDKDRKLRRFKTPFQ